MGGDRGDGGGWAGARTSPWKIASCHLFPRRKTGPSFLENVTGLAIALSSADAQADLRHCCLHATKSSFSQRGTYGMG